MAAATSIPEPGVEIIQELRTVTPQIVAPTLAPCVMGVCNQILEVTESDGTINSDAALSGPAVATAPNVQASYNLNGDTLIVAVNGGPNQTFTFSGTDPMTASAAVTDINGATPAPSGFAAYAYEDASGWHLQLRTTASGATQSIQIVGGTGLTDLGWNTSVGWTYFGLGTYTNRNEFVPQTSLPDPRGIIDELDVDEDSIRVFLDLGTEIREMLDTESFLMKGAGDNISTNPGAEPFDDGDGDTTTPYMSLEDGAGAATAVNLIAAATQATVTGTADLSAAKQIHNQTLMMSLDGSETQTLVLVGQPIMTQDTTGFTWTNVQSNVMVMIVNGVTVTVTFSAGVAAIDTMVSEINAQAVIDLGAGTVVAYRANQYGDEAGAGTYIGFFYGGLPSTVIWPNASVKIEDSTGGSTAALMTEVFGSDVDQFQTNTGAKVDPSQPIEDIEGQIDALFGNIASIDGSNYLVLTSATSGQESKLYIDSASTALTNLGLTAGTYNGGAFPAKAGDYLYGDGTYLGMIVEVHSGAVQGRVKLDTEQSLTTNYIAWYIVSKNLDNYDSGTEWGVIVPTPDFYVDTNGDLHIKHDFLRDTTGTPIGSTPVGLYVAYDALRLDVTPDAESPALLAFDDIDDLEDALGPLSPDNPLGYGLSLALANAGAVRVYGVGVPDVSSDRPFGTVTGWQKVADFLESKGVWGLAQLTDDSESIQIMRTHVLAMSQAEQKGERVLYCYLGRPTREANTIVSSGTDGDRISTSPDVFDTKVATLSQDLLAADVDPTNITVADDVYLDISADAKAYNITGNITNGTEVTINTTFAADENTDSFYTTDAMPASISETFSVVVRGASISSDTDKEIETVVARGEGFASRRVRMPQLDRLRASVDGVEQLVDGFYITAAKVGQVAGNPPSTPYTNFPITGFTGVTGSNDIYSNTQMNEGTAGGAEWIVQSAAGVPLTSRHQVTTDLTSVETTEQSITNALDYVALFMRAGLRNFIGRYNISDTFLDTLASVVQGQLAWLKEKKVIAGGDLNNIIQDTTNATRVLIDCTILPFYPCNYIRVTLVV
jgi:hypothetical protein